MKDGYSTKKQDLKRDGKRQRESERVGHPQRKERREGKGDGQQKRDEGKDGEYRSSTTKRDAGKGRGEGELGERDTTQ